MFLNKLPPDKIKAYKNEALMVVAYLTGRKNAIICDTTRISDLANGDEESVGRLSELVGFDVDIEDRLVDVAIRIKEKVTAPKKKRERADMLRWFITFWLLITIGLGCILGALCLLTENQVKWEIALPLWGFVVVVYAPMMSYMIAKAHTTPNQKRS